MAHSQATRNGSNTRIDGQIDSLVQAHMPSEYALPTLLSDETVGRGYEDTSNKDLRVTAT